MLPMIIKNTHPKTLLLALTLGMSSQIAFSMEQPTAIPSPQDSFYELIRSKIGNNHLVQTKARQLADTYIAMDPKDEKGVEQELKCSWELLKCLFPTAQEREHALHLCTKEHFQSEVDYGEVARVACVLVTQNNDCDMILGKKPHFPSFFAFIKHKLTNNDELKRYAFRATNLIGKLTGHGVTEPLEKELYGKLFPTAHDQDEAILHCGYSSVLDATRFAQVATAAGLILCRENRLKREEPEVYQTLLELHKNFDAEEALHSRERALEEQIEYTKHIYGIHNQVFETYPDPDIVDKATDGLEQKIKQLQQIYLAEKAAVEKKIEEEHNNVAQRLWKLHLEDLAKRHMSYDN